MLSLIVPQVAIRADLPLPESIQMEAEPFARDWRVMKEAEPGELERKLSEAGWEFLRVPAEVVTGGAASDAERAWREAIEEFLSCAQQQGADAVEIRQIRMKKLGWYCYAMVQGYLRRVQAAPTLVSAKEASGKEPGQEAA